MSELLLRGLGLLAAIVLDFVVSYLLYTSGWLVLRLLTLGRYPRLPLRVDERAVPESPLSASSA